MQLLFLFLFGGVVSFILYLSYDRHITEKKNTNKKEELEIDLTKYKDLIETNDTSKTEELEKVEDEVLDNSIEEVEIVKFHARRNKDKVDKEEEEII